jgi:hypothetical protein
MEKEKFISNEKKLASLVSILPVLMDFMEDVKDVYPKLYVKQIKKSGNDFITEILKQSDQLYDKMDIENDEELKEFLYQLENMGLAFRNWLKE